MAPNWAKLLLGYLNGDAEVSRESDLKRKLPFITDLLIVSFSRLQKL